ncbi:hypothetical protein Hsw_0203 [Hymenobacter swuensis DY53]|uniref:Uncharacterized protein n=1 Tax=Hymenobacter swuensis DY53 TaxID=1227739 RepID=W8ETB7_9BACT|nr:hypothetical protein Hsw_0203 [Hymenobacter swuensis DY53]
MARTAAKYGQQNRLAHYSAFKLLLISAYIYPVDQQQHSG